MINNNELDKGFLEELKELDKKESQNNE